MSIAVRASWCRRLLGLAFLGALVPLTVSSRPARADLLYFKDGFALEGRVKREMTLEFDQVGKEAYHMPKGFFFVDDGPRRIFFSPAQVRYVYSKDPSGEERIVCPDTRIQVNAKKLPELLEVVKAPEWDNSWNRRFQFRSPNGPVDVPQHLGLLTPFWARADSPGKFFWSCAYLTRELGPERVQALLYSHKDFQETKDMATAQRVSRRLRKADFYAQAGWFDLAEAELEKALRDMPDQKDRVEAARKMLLKLSARERLEEIKRRHNAGQHKKVHKMLAEFPTAGATDKMIAELEELKADYENTDRLLADTARLLEAARKAGASNRVLAGAAEEIGENLNFENVGRLDAFLGQARQAERFRKKGKKGDLSVEQLLSLAVSGWLLGSASAETSPETALRLWRGRTLVRKYLRTDEEADRRKLIEDHKRGSRTESASLDELIQIIRTLPPPEGEQEVTDKVLERKIGGSTYLLRLPPEYRHGRPFPVLLVLHESGDTPRQMLDRWSDAAAENGFILVAPEWQPGGGLRGGGNYTYSEAEHRVVLNTLRDVRRRFNADEDRVFLFGQGEGGLMAFDVGLGHPDLFAGVLPMAASPQYQAEICWRNGQYLPFYVVHGNRGPNGDKVRHQFELWVQRNFPMLWVDYKGRGIEWFGGEVPLMFDWMHGKKRPFPMDHLGESGSGTSFGKEFCTLRAGDNHFYWISTDDVRFTRSYERWKFTRTQPASLCARISKGPKSNDIKVETNGGLGNVTIWLGRNGKGEDMIDFDNPVIVTVTPGFQVKWNRKVAPSLEVLLEDLYQRGDRQQLFLAKIPLQLLGRAKGR